MNAMQKVSLSICSALAVVTMLSGCGGASNNLTPPGDRVYNDCDDLDGAVCITGRFVMDAVENLDYECGDDTKVVSVTSEDGNFTCPKDSQVTFFLSDTARSRRITLGSVKVTPMPDVASVGVVGAFIVTPQMLVGAADATTFGSAAKNIARLLYALDSDGVQSSSYNVVRISQEDKDKIVALSADVSKEALSALDFDAQVAPFISQISHQWSGVLPGNDFDVEERLSISLNSTRAGFYTVTTAVNFVNSGDTWRFLSNAYLINDRRGRVWGGGWGIKALSSSTTAVPVGAYTAQGDYNGFGLDGRIDDENPITLRADGGVWNMVLQQGRLYRDYIANSDDAYRTLYGLSDTDNVDERSLGEVRVTGTPGINTNFAASRTAVSQTTLYPEIWGALQARFPLHLVLKFKNSPELPANPVEANVGLNGVSREVWVDILEDGSIVTDIDMDCVAVNPVTLEETVAVDPDAEVLTYDQEYVIGVIERAYKNSSNRHYLKPLLFIPAFTTSPLSNLKGVSFGLNTQYSGRIRVNPGVSDYLKMFSERADTDTTVPWWYSESQYYKQTETDKTALADAIGTIESRERTSTDCPVTP